MSDTAYTRGPWVWGYHGPDDEWVRTSEGDAIVLVGHNAAERTENARLIAASPELLEALRGILEIGKRDMSNPKYDEYFATARAAIAKAEGREVG